MEKTMKLASCRQGRVQRREYQLYLLQIRDEERMAMLRGLNIAPRPIKKIRIEFEQQYGSRFMVI